MEKEDKKVSRTKFLTWGLGISSLLSIPAFLKLSGAKKQEKKIVKMLAQDGKLVEIDVAHIPAKKKKVKNDDIHNWINKKN